MHSIRLMIIHIERFKQLSIIIGLLVTHLAYSQSLPVPRDTSFTTHSAFIKESKKYPFIEIVRSELPESVLKNNDVVYNKIKDRQLLADIFYPSHQINGGYPGVILIHGGGWRSGDKSLQVPMAQQLAAHGYVTMTVEYRLSPEAPYPAAVHDLKAAVRWLRANAKEYGLDPVKIAVLGCSAGGQLAALVGTTNGNEEFEGDRKSTEQSSEVQAIVDIDGILAFKHPESKEGEVAAQWLGGTAEERPEIWEEASALTHVNANTPPVLFLASSHPRFHAGKEDMIKILEKYGIYYESHVIPDTPHPFWLFHPWFEPTAKIITSFLDKVLKDGQ
jgi:acetyl esterase/lipase